MVGYVPKNHYFCNRKEKDTCLHTGKHFLINLIEILTKNL